MTKLDPRGAARGCPQCGGGLVVSPAPSVRETVRRMTAHGSNAPYAQNFAETVAEKEARLGVVVRCSHCRYLLRASEAAAGAASDAA